MASPTVVRLFPIALSLIVAATASSCVHGAAAAMTAPQPADQPAYKQDPQLVATADAAGPNADPATAAGQHDLVATIADLRGLDRFFGLNDDVLTDPARARLSAVADVLAQHAPLKMNVEGNSDGNGTAASDLILSEKRADRVKKYLLNRGARDEQVATVSSGNARAHGPRQENRRDDVVVENPLGSP